MADDPVAAHYSRGGLASIIADAVAKAVSDLAELTIDDLAPLDEFHIGGRAATVHFFERLGLAPDQSVLDVGAGIGGTARFVAHTYGSDVMAIDFTPDYCEVAETLNAMVGLSDRVTVENASALDMPFDRDSFDVAYIFHVGMNIADKDALFAEVNRVLRPGGRLGIYDILKGPGRGDFQFPVSWAADAATSFLATIDEMRTILDESGFVIDHEENRTAFALEIFERWEASGSGDPPVLGTHLLMGSDAPAKSANLLANLKAGRCEPWEIVCRS
jgi:SAM-dependent methyltransferase